MMPARKKPKIININLDLMDSRRSPERRIHDKPVKIRYFDLDGWLFFKYFFRMGVRQS